MQIDPKKIKSLIATLLRANSQFSEIIDANPPHPNFSFLNHQQVLLRHILKRVKKIQKSLPYQAPEEY